MNVLDKFLDAIKLNDDYDDFDDDYLDDDDLEDEFQEDKPRRRFFKKVEDEEDLDDIPQSKTKSFTKAKAEKASAKQVKPAKQTSSKITPMRSSKRPSQGKAVTIIKPTSMEDTRVITDALIDECTVVLNLEGIDMELAQRIVDFISGSCYAINGGLQMVSSYIFVLTPRSVDVSGDYQEVISASLGKPTIRTEYSV